MIILFILDFQFVCYNYSIIVSLVRTNQKMRSFFLHFHLMYQQLIIMFV